jgi:hypothetical protein
MLLECQPEKIYITWIVLCNENAGNRMGVIAICQRRPCPDPVV